MTTYEQILACKPASILDVVPRSVFYEIDDPAHSYITSGRVYEWKYAVAKYLQPRAVLEIGVRFGYSLCTFLAAAPSIKTIWGIDSEVYVKGSNARAAHNLKAMGHVGAILQKSNSMDVSCVFESDLAHIDGSHNYDNCLHDLNLCLGTTKAILIDDVDNCHDDRNACAEFIRQHPDAIQEVLHLPSLMGDLLILLKPA